MNKQMPMLLHRTADSPGNICNQHVSEKCSRLRFKLKLKIPAIALHQQLCTGSITLQKKDAAVTVLHYMAVLYLYEEEHHE